MIVVYRLEQMASYKKKYIKNVNVMEDCPQYCYVSGGTNMTPSFKTNIYMADLCCNIQHTMFEGSVCFYEAVLLVFALYL